MHALHHAVGKIYANADHSNTLSRGWYNKQRDLLKASTKRPNHIWAGQWTIWWLIVILDGSHHT